MRTRPVRPGRRAALALAVLAFAAPADARVAESPLAARLGAALASAPIAPDGTGALAIDLATGGLVYTRNAARPLRPASNEKLPVALAALDELGPAFRIETQVLGKGSLEAGVWRGNLVLKGYGDPTLSSEDLARLAAKVRAAGVVRVTGAIVGDESFFDRRRTVPGWKASYYKQECAPLSALVVDEARVGGRVVDRPALAAAIKFRRALAAAGVRVSGRARVGVASPTAAPLAGVVSRRLALVVRRMNRKSDNFVAEMLLKQLGARELGAGSSAAGARVVLRALRARGVPVKGVRIVDGSGLSRYDRLTARALVALLVSAWSDAVLADPFVASLAVGGVNGTLEDRFERPPARARVYAKTGTTDRASSLSGYVGDDYVFSILMNRRPMPTWSARRAQDRFVQLLAAN